MANKKVCKTCNIFVEGDKCPICGKASFSTSWTGRINVIDPAKSKVAKKMNLDVKGEYAIKVN